MSGIRGMLDNYPDITFIKNLTLEELQNRMLSDFQEKYKEITGKKMTLSQAHPIRLILYATALQLYQAFQYLDKAGKQSFLKYAYGDYLENLGALKGISRNQGERARCTISFTLSALQNNPVMIPVGTRVTPGDEIYFYTTESAEIPAGEWSVDVQTECADVGAMGNGYEPGTITILVDLIPYIQGVTNINISAGGQEAEKDENLAERIFLAPTGYSVAGPDAAYQYWAKQYHSGIADVKVSSPTEGVVDIRFIMLDGELPSESLVNGLQEYLRDNKVRPLTDYVQVGIPEIVPCDIDIVYYIGSENASRATQIKKCVEDAVEIYKVWQQEQIGRDINPSKLIYYIVQAEAKRAEVRSPEFKTISDIAVARIQNVNIVFGGFEGD